MQSNRFNRVIRWVTGTLSSWQPNFVVSRPASVLLGCRKQQQVAVRAWLSDWTVTQLAFASSPYHFFSSSSLILCRDYRHGFLNWICEMPNWESMAQLTNDQYQRQGVVWTLWGPNAPPPIQVNYERDGEVLGVRGVKARPVLAPTLQLVYRWLAPPISSW